MAVRFLGRFVGRGEELAGLLAALERAQQGRSAVVVVSGDAGIGKTRLLLEFVDRAQRRGVRVLSGGCVELGDIGLPYLPVVEALRGLAVDPDGAELLAEVAVTAPGIGRLLPGVVQPSPSSSHASGNLDQLQVFDAIRALLLGCSARSPVVLMLEDLHWSDRATRDLIAFLARTLGSGRVLLVTSYRSDELHPHHPLRPLLAELVRVPSVERMQLGPFSPAELAEQLEAISGARLAADWVAQIQDRSEGNPFYAEQLVAAGAHDPRVGLPPTLVDVLVARLQVLSEPAQEVLRAAAVAGRRVHHRLLAQVSGRPEPALEQALREAIGAGLLVVDRASGTYAFQHALLQEAVYGELLPSEQVRLHRAYAQLLAAEDGRAAELAHHRLASHDLVGALAASVQAAKEAAAVLAPAETLRHLSTALELWEQVPDPAGVTGTNRVDLMLEAAKAASAASDPRALALAQDAAAIAEATADSAQAARAHEQLGWHLLHAQQVKAALGACARAVELVPADPPTRQRARVIGIMAQALLSTGHYGEARRWCDQALAAARDAGSASDEADALITLGRLEAFDDPASARRLYATARSWAVEAGNREIELRVLRTLGWLEYTLGNLTAARAVYDDGAELAQRSGLGWSPLGIAMRCGQIYVPYVAGAWDDGEQLGAASELVTTLGAAWLVLEGLAVSVARGRMTAAKRLSDVAVLAAVDPNLDLTVAAVQAELAMWQGDLEGARSASQRAIAAIDEIKPLDQLFFFVWVASIGLTAAAERAQQARIAGIATTLQETSRVGAALLERIRWAMRQPYQTGRTRDVHMRGWHAKAEAEWTRLEGRSDPARWQAAVEAFSFGHVYEVARCRWRLAEALLGRGRREEAMAAAQAAYLTAVRLGAAPLCTALEALARRARLDLGAGVPQAPRAVGLTPRELEVLHLLVAGKSNRQIAEQLFISGKTATTHVTSILAKLGVHSRLEAAARARELGFDRRSASHADSDR